MECGQASQHANFVQARPALSPCATHRRQAGRTASLEDRQWPHLPQPRPPSLVCAWHQCPGGCVEQHDGNCLTHSLIINTCSDGARHGRPAEPGGSTGGGAGHRSSAGAGGGHGLRSDWLSRCAARWLHELPATAQQILFSSLLRRPRRQPSAPSRPRRWAGLLPGGTEHAARSCACPQTCMCGFAGSQKSRGPPATDSRHPAAASARHCCRPTSSASACWRASTLPWWQRRTNCFRKMRPCAR